NIGPGPLNEEGDGDSSGAEAENVTPTGETAISSLKTSKSKKSDRILLALPNALNTGGIDVFHLPSERRVFTIPADSSTTTGMVMALAINLPPPSHNPTKPES